MIKITIKGTIKNEVGEEIADLNELGYKIERDGLNGFKFIDIETGEELCNIPRGVIKYLEFLMR